MEEEDKEADEAKRRRFHIWSRHLRAWKRAPFDFVSGECGGEGDCLFRAIAVGLTELYPDAPCSMRDVRRMLADSLDVRNCDAFIEHCKSDFRWFDQITIPKAADARVTWLRRVVCTQGYRFLGTDTVVLWLATHARVFREANLGFVVFHSTLGPEQVLCVQPRAPSATENRTNRRASALPEPRYLLLLNLTQTHWQLAYVKDAGTNRMFSCVTHAAMRQLLPRGQEPPYQAAGLLL